MQNSIERLLWAGNQGYHQNLEKNDTSYETHKKKFKTAEEEKAHFQAWCGSTYTVVRLSDINSNFFFVFLGCF